MLSAYTGASELSGDRTEEDIHHSRISLACSYQLVVFISRLQVQHLLGVALRI